MTGFAIEVELLTGGYRAARVDGAGPEWPPHPDRLFSALVQSWGDGGRDDDERRALEWLETRPAPAIEASAQHFERTAPTVFVPPNDQPTLPEARRRQARSFHAAIPSDPIVRFIWGETATGSQLSALGSLASRIASLGHSSSVVRTDVIGSHAVDPSRCWCPSDDGGAESIRVPYPGRLLDLERWFDAHERPELRAVARYRPPGPAALSVPESCFGGDWLVFEGDGGEPDVLAFAHVARRVRDALMATSRVQPAPELLSGHGPGGGPSQRPHLAVVPLLNVGWPHSDGALLGLGLVFPRTVRPDERRVLLEAIAGFTRPGEDAELVAELRLTSERVWRLQRSERPSRASVRAARWAEAGTSWASVTPVLLDRFPRDDDPSELGQIIAQSCAAIGLPEPDEIEVHKHSGVTGAPTCHPSRGAASRPDWSFPTGSRLKDRVRRHVVLRFSTPVRGPVIIGAGRFHGFGLCLPVERAG